MKPRRRYLGSVTLGDLSEEPFVAIDTAKGE